MSKPDPSAPHVEEIKVENQPGGHDLRMRVDAGGASHTVTMDGPQVAALITTLTAKLMERQTPEALQLLQIFAIQRIHAGQTPDGVAFLQYRLENGLEFGTGIRPDEVLELHTSLSAMLPGRKPPASH